MMTALVCLCAAPQASAARIVCWTNSDGVRECGNAVPPEYAQGTTERKSGQGITLERTRRARTPEELAKARREREQLEKEEAERQRIAREQAQYDRVLLATFTTEQDLMLTRDGKIAAIDSRVRHGRQIGKKLEQSLAELEMDAARMERRGKQVSEELQAEISEVRTQVEENNEDIEQREQEKVQLNEQFSADLQRYRELKGVASN